MSRTDRLCLVICSLEGWDEVWRRNQYLVDALLLDDPQLEVLFVEPPADPLFAVTQRRMPKPGRGLRTVDGYQGRLRVLEPTKWLPRRLGDRADASLVRQLLRAVRGLDWTNPRLWINDPSWSQLVQRTAWPALYDMTDDWVEANRGEREHDRLVRADDELLVRCTEVVVCSTGLQLTKGARRPVTLIRNAVQVARYREPHARPPDFPDVPVALYAGTLHEDRLDVDLVLAAATSIHAVGGRLVLVGPDALSESNRARLSTSAAIDLLGSRPKDLVPAYLQHAHVLVVPHVIDDFTDSLDPIKLYEYLAVGRPIVSTAVAGFREAAGMPGVTIAAGAGFVAAVAHEISRWRPESVRADVPDWADRGHAMRTVIDRLADHIGDRA